MKYIDSDRVLAEVELEPIQGSRFQPTGFPSLGSAEFTHTSSDGQNTDSLLVESAQSMANRLEDVCWNKKDTRLVDTLEGMPTITINREDGNFLTNSLLEAHRMNSAYIMKSKDTTLKDKIKSELGDEKVDISKLARFALRYDPNSILHGLFLSQSDISGGRYKMTRSISSFIEATDVSPVVSGGVKLDHIDPKGGKSDKKSEEDGSSESMSGAKGGFGHIPYSRTEYSANSIKAYFNIDLALIRSYGLENTANEFLLTFALWKIQRFLKHGLRLRTACDLKVKDQLVIKYPESFGMPTLDQLDKDLKELIKKCKDEGLFSAEPLSGIYKK